MRKLSKAMRTRREAAVAPQDERPGRVAGGAITAKPSIGLIDITRLFSPQPVGPSVTSSAVAPQGTDALSDTVSLSDGTRITFADGTRFADQEIV